MESVQTGGERLREFLQASRARVNRLVLAREAFKATFWTAIGFIPLAWLRHGIGLPASLLLAAFPAVVAVAALIMTMLRQVEIHGVLAGLDLDCDRADLLVSAFEFASEERDPFKQLAMRQAEVWLAEHGREIECLWRWPRESRLCAPILALLGLLFCVAPRSPMSMLPRFASSDSAAVKPPTQGPPPLARPATTQPVHRATTAPIDPPSTQAVNTARIGIDTTQPAHPTTASTVARNDTGPDAGHDGASAAGPA